MSEKKTSIPLTELDKQTYCGPAQMLKAAVSYMDPSSGKMLAMLARMMEFRQTLELFEKEQISICSLSGGKRPGIEDILKYIRKYCSPAEGEQIDQFLNMLNAVRLYNEFSELTKNPDIAAMMNQMNSFKNMNSMNISPEQIQMLQTLLHTPSSGKGSGSS